MYVSNVFSPTILAVHEKLWYSHDSHMLTNAKSSQVASFSRKSIDTHERVLLHLTKSYFAILTR